MIDPTEIVQTEAQPAAIIRFTIPTSQIQTIMGPGLGALMAAVASQGIGPTGPLFSHHLQMTPDTFDFELGVPVSAPVTPVGRVTAGELPAARVARTTYHGPYEGLGDAWGEFISSLIAQGHSPAPDLWERYLAGPESGPDPSAWRTELNRPLLG